jgi:hypothetical protein
MDFDELIDGLSSRLGMSPAEVQFRLLDLLGDLLDPKHPLARSLARQSHEEFCRESAADYWRKQRDANRVNSQPKETLP